MTDKITPESRSRNMSRIRGRDTKPEIRLRSALHKAGLRFNVCRVDLPGRPDIIFPKQKLAVQVRGCFWHQHEDCGSRRIPKSNVDYWHTKLERNVRRDAEKDLELQNLGWKLIIAWECEIKDTERLADTVEKVKSALA